MELKEASIVPKPAYRVSLEGEEYNASEMKPTNSEWFESLSDELSQTDIIREKISGEDFSFRVDDSEE